jgi:hypothetical protein
MRDVIRSIADSYREVGKQMHLLIVADLFVNFVNAAFFILFNYYLEGLGYTDYEVAGIGANRFLAVMVAAVPFGFFVKGKRLRPFFVFATLVVPILSLLILEVAPMHRPDLLRWLLYGWSIGFMCIQVTSMPFLILNCPKHRRAEAISLFFQVGSFATFFVGLCNYILQKVWPDVFHEAGVLRLFALLGFVALYVVLRMDAGKEAVEVLPSEVDSGSGGLWGMVRRWGQHLGSYNWGMIGVVIVPTLFIAVGAGFTIPVINLFFLNVHGVTSSTFSMLGAVTFIVVTLGTMLMPSARRAWGYQWAITGLQSGAVLALFGLATTEYYAHWWGAGYVAMLFYLVRQPLMNLASPVAAELSVSYVGQHNQEMVSALNASIWAGSWYFSMKVFEWMRMGGYRYVSIFLITVVLYVLGTVWYAVLIRQYERRVEKEQGG